jgi:hypothetical protein
MEYSFYGVPRRSVNVVRPEQFAVCPLPLNAYLHAHIYAISDAATNGDKTIAVLTTK